MYYILETGITKNNVRLTKFQCDYTDDIANLPTSTSYGTVQEDNTSARFYVAIGSTCYCVEGKKTYTLASTDEWVVKSTTSSGGTIDEDTVKQIIATYLEENPVYAMVK